MTFRGKLGSLVGGLLAVAMLATAGMFFGQTARAQSPQSVPAARFYGTVRNTAGDPLKGATVTALVGGIQCGFGSSDNSGNYFVDVQSTAGCTTPGAKVSFSFQGAIMIASCPSQAGGPVIPSIQGSAVNCNLTAPAPATATPTPPPPPPTPSATTPPPPPPPPPPSTATPKPPTATPTKPPTTPPPATKSPTPKATMAPVVQQGGKNAQAPAKGPVKGPVTAQAPAKTAPAAAQAPAKAAQAPATAPRLPSTGNGGLLDQQSSNSLSGWAVLVIVLAALGISATGMFAYKRSR